MAGELDYGEIAAALKRLKSRVHKVKSRAPHTAPLHSSHCLSVTFLALFSLCGVLCIACVHKVKRAEADAKAEAGHWRGRAAAFRSAAARIRAAKSPSRRLTCGRRGPHRW